MRDSEINANEPITKLGHGLHLRINKTQVEQQINLLQAIDQRENPEEKFSEKAAEWLEESKVHTHISSEDIEKAVKRIKKSTGGGPQQITPWMLKQAVEGSSNGSCSLAIAKLSN